MAPVEHITFDIEVGFIEIMSEKFDVNNKIFPGGLVTAVGSPAPPLPRHGQERGRRVRVLRAVHVSAGSRVSLQTRAGRQDHSLQTLAQGIVQER